MPDHTARDEEALTQSPHPSFPHLTVQITPTPGSPHSIFYADFVLAVKLKPMWIHTGWIDVIWRFRRTRIGQFWHTLSLAALVIVMGVIWSTILKQDPIQYFRFVGTSMIVWSLVASFVTDGAAALISGEATALSMRFPYIAFAFQHAWKSLLLFAHHFVLYLAIIILTLQLPGYAVFLAIPGLFLVVANGVWMTLLVGMLCLKRRDFVLAIATAMQIGMFVTPVFWPKAMLGERLAFAADFNPLYHLMTILRDPLLGIVPPLESWLASLATLLVGWLLTAWIYGRFRDRMSYWY